MNEAAMILVALLGTGGLGAIAASIVTALISRRKLGAEAEKFGAEAADLIAKAASSVVTDLRTDLDRAREDMRRMRDEHTAELVQEREDRAKEREDVRRVLQLHVAWDVMAIAKLTELGADVSDFPDVPPLMPPLHNF